MNTFKRLCAAVLTVTLLPVSGLAAPAAESFSDVPANAWYANAVQTCLETGLMTGRGDGKFAPTAAVTYGEAAAMAARVYSLTHGDNGEVPPAKEGERWWAGAARYLDESGALAPIKDVKPKEEYYHFLDNENGSLLDALSYYPALNIPEDELQRWPDDEDRSWLYTRFADQTSPRLFFLLLAACAMPEDQLAGDAGMTSLPDYRPELDAYSPVYAELVLRLYNAGVLTGGDEWGTVNYSDPLTRAEAAALLVRLTDETKRVSAPLKALPGTLEPLLIGSVCRDYITYCYDEDTDEYLLRYDPDSLADLFSSGIYPAQAAASDLYGYYNVAEQTWLIEPRFERANAFGPFSLAVAVEDGFYVLVNKSGKLLQKYGILENFYIDNATVLSDQLVLLNGRNASTYYQSGLYRPDGTAVISLSANYKILMPECFDWPLWVQDAASHLWGALDETGVLVIPYSYSYVYPFYEGRALVYTSDGKHQIIDKTGRVLIEDFASGRFVSSGDCGLYVVRSQDEKYGVIDSYGREVLPAEYDDIYYQGDLQIIQAYQYRNENILYFTRDGRPLSTREYESYPSCADLIAPLAGPYDLRRKGSSFAFFSTDGAQLTPYLFYGEPLYLPKLERYIVRIHEASYLYSPAA